MAERAPPPADPPGPQFMAEKLARLDADLHRLLDAAAPMREDCAARDPRAPAERLRHAHRLRPTSGPPPGWAPGEPIENFLPPAPQPEVMRAGAPARAATTRRSGARGDGHRARLGARSGTVTGAARPRRRKFI